MKKLNSKICVITLILLITKLAGCSVQKEYTEPVRKAYDDVYYVPEVDKSANIYFDVPFHVHVGFYSDENCAYGRYGTRVEFSDLESEFSVGGYKPRNTVYNSMKGTVIYAEEPMIIGMNLRKTEYKSEKAVSSMCDFTIKFKPKENHDYVLFYELSEEKCSTGVIDITESLESGKATLAEGMERLDKTCSIYRSYSEYKIPAKQ
jgi:hypothetical protein